ncbi:hypothetical protein CEXT_356421 [Caerostris extrusa]|uniref:Uncharacterized protein n=1 Tax=Caerostris extrusa TaxID=172846 RepID=A0AAV4XP08_CAEEX|nr:hypothetical protein CEXT_356421 [Caerostris extrusa]
MHRSGLLLYNYLGDKAIWSKYPKGENWRDHILETNGLAQIYHVYYQLLSSCSPNQGITTYSRLEIIGLGESCKPPRDIRSKLWCTIECSEVLN